MQKGRTALGLLNDKPNPDVMTLLLVLEATLEVKNEVRVRQAHTEQGNSQVEEDSGKRATTYALSYQLMHSIPRFFVYTVVFSIDEERILLLIH